MDDWMDDLRSADGALRPEPGALGEVQEEVRRRRRRRSASTALAAAASVAVVVGGVAVAFQRGDGPRDRVVGDPSEGTASSAPTPPGSTATFSADDPRTFECLTESKVLDPDAAPVLDSETAQVYKRTYSEIAQREFEEFALRRVEIFHAGVFVLVTGDVEEARHTLTPYGVAGVGLWNPDGPALGMDEYAQLEQLIQWRLEPVLEHARRAVEQREDDGFAGLAVWINADAILVQWKDPVPAEIRALEDTRFKSGAEIIVQAVRYSRAEIREAQQRVPEGLRANESELWTTSRACGDFSGLVVGMEPSFLENADRADLQSRLAEVVGMPVHVAPEGPVVELDGNAG